MKMFMKVFNLEFTIFREKTFSSLLLLLLLLFCVLVECRLVKKKQKLYFKFNL